MDADTAAMVADASDARNDVMVISTAVDEHEEADSQMTDIPPDALPEESAPTTGKPNPDFPTTTKAQEANLLLQMHANHDMAEKIDFNSDDVETQVYHGEDQQRVQHTERQERQPLELSKSASFQTEYGAKATVPEVSLSGNEAVRNAGADIGGLVAGKVGLFEDQGEDAMSERDSYAPPLTLSTHTTNDGWIKKVVTSSKPIVQANSVAAVVKTHPKKTDKEVTQDLPSRNVNGASKTHWRDDKPQSEELLPDIEQAADPPPVLPENTQGAVAKPMDLHLAPALNVMCAICKLPFYSKSGTSTECMDCRVVDGKRRNRNRIAAVHFSPEAPVPKKVGKKQQQKKIDSHLPLDTTSESATALEPATGNKAGKKRKTTPQLPPHPNPAASAPGAKRPASDYNLFVKSELTRIKAECPGIDQKAAFAQAASNWRAFKSMLPLGTGTQPLPGMQMDSQAGHTNLCFTQPMLHNARQQQLLPQTSLAPPMLTAAAPPPRPPPVDAACQAQLDEDDAAARELIAVDIPPQRRLYFAVALAIAKRRLGVRCVGTLQSWDDPSTVISVVAQAMQSQTLTSQNALDPQPPETTRDATASSLIPRSQTQTQTQTQSRLETITKLRALSWLQRFHRSTTIDTIDTTNPSCDGDTGAPIPRPVESSVIATTIQSVLDCVRDKTSVPMSDAKLVCEALSSITAKLRPSGMMELQKECPLVGSLLSSTVLRGIEKISLFKVGASNAVGAFAEDDREAWHLLVMALAGCGEAVCGEAMATLMKSMASLWRKRPRDAESMRLTVKAGPADGPFVELVVEDNGDPGRVTDYEAEQNCFWLLRSIEELLSRCPMWLRSTEVRWGHDLRELLDVSTDLMQGGRAMVAQYIWHLGAVALEVSHCSAEKAMRWEGGCKEDNGAKNGAAGAAGAVGAAGQGQETRA